MYMYRMKSGNKENNLIILLPSNNSTISPLPVSSFFALSCLLFFLVDQTKYFVLSLRVRVCVSDVLVIHCDYSVCLPLFAFPFAS